MMNLEKWQGSSVVCQPLGALDLEAASEFRHRIAAILRPELDLVLDLSHVDYIDASGASALVGSLRRVRAMGGNPRVCHVNPRIRWVLDIIGVDRFVTEPSPPSMAPSGPGRNSTPETRQSECLAA